MSFAGSAALADQRDAPEVGPPEQEALAIDNTVQSYFSKQAHAASDVFLYTSLFSPMAVIMAGPGGGGGKGRAVSVYGIAHLTNYVLTSGTKSWAQRPRPYMHHPHAHARAYGHGRRDNFRSFYSGHASIAFTSATAGSLLSSAYVVDQTQRRLMWGVEYAMASATATLRVRGGKHYYTDVMVGALAGTLVGALASQHLTDLASENIGTPEITAGVIGTISGCFSFVLPFSDDLRADGTVWRLTPYLDGESYSLLVAADL